MLNFYMALSLIMALSGSVKACTRAHVSESVTPDFGTGIQVELWDNSQTPTCTGHGGGNGWSSTDSFTIQCDNGGHIDVTSNGASLTYVHDAYNSKLPITAHEFMQSKPGDGMGIAFVSTYNYWQFDDHDGDCNGVKDVSGCNYDFPCK